MKHLLVLRSAMYLFQNIALDCTSVPLMFRPTFHLFHFHLPLSTRSWRASQLRLFVLFPDHTAWIWNFIPLQYHELVKLRGIISLHWNLCTLENSRFLDSNETWSKHYTYRSLSSTLSQALPRFKDQAQQLGHYVYSHQDFEDKPLCLRSSEVETHIALQSQLTICTSAARRKPAKSLVWSWA